MSIPAKPVVELTHDEALVLFELLFAYGDAAMVDRWSSTMLRNATPCGAGRSAREEPRTAIFSRTTRNSSRLREGGGW